MVQIRSKNSSLNCCPQIEIVKHFLSLFLSLTQGVLHSSDGSMVILAKSLKDLTFWQEMRLLCSCKILDQEILF